MFRSLFATFGTRVFESPSALSLSAFFLIFDTPFFLHSSRLLNATQSREPPFSHPVSTIHPACHRICTWATPIWASECVQCQFFSQGPGHPDLTPFSLAIA